MIKDSLYYSLDIVQQIKIEHMNRKYKEYIKSDKLSRLDVVDTVENDEIIPRVVIRNGDDMLIVK